ncbi:carboxyl transferase domain-containing protein [Blastococcus sp. Marseille-P5729]|uniref:carboxyl transferase domain-containing protein n=1 Tax=Blastococcus sp. Marseille-P5729 TaxID=2086582 RepID=UPI000D0FE183|nr:carboxyl transferase domain-containing protein [Blastococcus sp. Marseille-P5729]
MTAATPVEQKPVRLTARELIDLTLDDGSFVSWDTPLHYPEDAVEGASQEYVEQLVAATETAGTDESVITGEGLLSGRRIAIIASEFKFLAGSIGKNAADRIVAAVQRATAEGLPLVAAPSSGGTRMQEGTPAFLQMIDISKAVTAHKAAGLSYLVYLRNPTTGGVMASWGSLGQVTAAEPKAMLGFLGPRVFEAIYDKKFPDGVQVAENLYKKGIIDAVVTPQQVGKLLDKVLRITSAAEGPIEVPRPEMTTQDPDALPDADVWQSVLASRRPNRPGVRDLLRIAASDVVPLNGTGQGERDPGLLLALARFSSYACVVLGQDRRMQTANHQLGPEGLRVARRGMLLATELGLPLVTVIDTPGAALSAEAENGGLAGEIARCLADLSTVRTPTVAIMMGQGTGGAALALLPSDRVIAAQNSWLSPLPPEGASAIIHRTIDHADEMARAQKVSVKEMLQAGAIHTVVLENPDAADEPNEFCERLSEALQAELSNLTRRPLQALLTARGVPWA